MASVSRCFTFLWKLENASYCIQKEEEEITSPAFVVDAIEGTKWRLRLYPRGDAEDENTITYYLHRDKDSGGRENVEIKYELAFIGVDGSILGLDVYKDIFSKGIGLGQALIENVFETKRSIFLPNDTLSFRCRIWRVEGEMSEAVRCTALTRIGVEKRTYKWDVKNFSTLESGKKLNHQFETIQNNLPLMSVDLSLTGGLDQEEIIRFDLSLQDQSIKFATMRLFLINSSGNRVECNKEEMWFDPPTPCKQITFTLTKKNLLERKSVYLPNDTLSLIWEWGFSKGVVSEEPEEDEHGCICSEVKISDAQNCCDHQKTLLKHFVDDVKCLYAERFLSDVKLKTNTGEFPAHKFMLCTSSSVFKAMFSSEMKEKIDDCVYIEDLDDDTVNRMLLFIYSRSVEDLTWESASKLYAAADKYAIFSLKKICSSFLKENLSQTNSCNALLLADFHTDDELKSYVQDYIVKNGKQISKSDEWKALMKANGTLAAETLCGVFK